MTMLVAEQKVLYQLACGSFVGRHGHLLDIYASPHQPIKFLGRYDM